MIYRYEYDNNGKPTTLEVIGNSEEEAYRELEKRIGVREAETCELLTVI